MTRLLLAAACGAAFVLPGLAPAQAQSYAAQSRYDRAPSYEECRAAQRNRQVTGAVIGGVLGAVIGAELHDDSQDRARSDHRYRRGYGYRDHRGYRRHSGYRHRGHYEEGQGGAVLAGGGLGALAGAALGGAGGDCDRLARRAGGGYGYGGAPGHYGADAGYRGGDRRYDPGYASGRYDDGGYGYAGQGYDDGYGRSSGELLGGPDHRSGSYDAGRQAQVYTAGSARGGASAPPTGACRDMQSAGRLVYMCQGADGIWRPAETYR